MRFAGTLIALYTVSSLLSATVPLPALAADAPNPPASKTALVPNHPRQVLKFGNQFLLLDDTGLMPFNSPYGYGLYIDDTRYLNGWDLRINNTPLTLLSSNLEDGYAARFVYGNTPSVVPSEKLMIERTVLINDRVREHIQVTNFDIVPRTMNVSIRFGNDFADMFEVRGQARPKSGSLAEPVVSMPNRDVLLSYSGLDGKTMQTRVAFSKEATKLTGNEAVFEIKLDPHQSWEVDSAVCVGYDGKTPASLAGTSFADEKKAADLAYKEWRNNCASISTDNPDFNKWIERSYKDIYILRQPMTKGKGIAAGVPWFAVAFGRDQEVVSLETLPFMPELTRDVLALLCAYQGTKDDPFTQEKPGRIMHELRLGEMARLKEIPFIPYYGTVDATPLFLMLLGKYVDTTGDIEFARAHWENVKRALVFLDKESRGEYLRYGYGKDSRLTNIGWKDSGDSVMYGDGNLVNKLPIALSEVQGYLYAGWLSTAKLADKLELRDDANLLRVKAAKLRANFNRDFWNEKLGIPVLALDGDNRQCDVVSSNPGHLLMCDILDQKTNEQVADRLMQPDMFSGWGIRTLSADTRSYNPLSYHNGSVWPHDNGLIAAGLGHVHKTELASKVLGSMFQVAQSEPGWRMPELFCGFDRTFSEKPIWYPVSCSPQAWAAASVFAMIQGSLGVSLNADTKTLTVANPKLPQSVTKMQITGLRVGKGTADIKVERGADGGVTVTKTNATGVDVQSSSGN